MKTQHTPGPWDTEPKGSRHFVDGADGLTVAYLDRAGVRERAEIEANALLIASAPELLAELERTEASLTAILCSRVIDSTTSTWLELRRNRDAIRSAIARATGGNAL